MKPRQLKPARDVELSSLERHRSYQRESGLFEDAARLVWWSTMRASLAVMHRLRVHGRERLPAEPPFVLVANHASHLDTMVLGSLMPLKLRDHVFPLAAGDHFFETPTWAAFSATFLNALPVWRRNCGAHAIQDLRARLLEEPTIYILFPEGSRSRDGTIQQFKSGVGMLTAETSVPVVPCHLSGTFDAFPPQNKLPRLRSVSATIGPPRVFQDAKNCREGWDEISRTLEADVRRLAEHRNGRQNGADKTVHLLTTHGAEHR